MRCSRELQGRQEVCPICRCDIERVDIGNFSCTYVRQSEGELLSG